MLVKKSADYTGRPQTYVFNKQSLGMSGVILKGDFFPLYHCMGCIVMLGLKRRITQASSTRIRFQVHRCVWIHGLETAQTRFSVLTWLMVSVTVLSKILFQNYAPH